MPQLDAHSFASQLFWLVATFVPLYLILWKVALPRVVSTLEGRQSHIDHDLERASSLKEEADQAIVRYQAALAEARATARQELRAATEAAAAEAAQRHAALAQKLDQDIAAAEARIATARDAAVGEIGELVRELAGMAVERLSVEAPAAADLSAAVEAAMGERA
jgi:F-type H+-transporting ATPase subunit b